MTTIDGIDVPVIGRKHLMQNKRSTGREKDRLELKTLERGDIDRD